MVSLSRDHCLSGNERKYYNWLTERFPQSDYLVYPNIALQTIFKSELKEDLKPGWPNHDVYLPSVVSQKLLLTGIALDRQ